MRKHGLLLVLMIILSLNLIACGGRGRGEEEESAAPESVSESIDVVMNDMYYGDENTNLTDPPVWTVTNGAEVTVNLENQGALQHNWAIVRPGQEVPEPYTAGEENPDLLQFNAGIMDAGASDTATFSAPEPGEYLVICTVAGHYPNMQGRLIVE